MKKAIRLMAGLAALVLLLTCCTAAMADRRPCPWPGEHEVNFYARKGGKLLYTLVTGPDGKLQEELRSTYRDGLVFMGWFTAPYGGKRIGKDTVFWKDTNVWAHWGRIEGREKQPVTPGVYTVTFLEDDASRTLPSSVQTNEEGKLEELPEPTVEKKKGQKFLGWRNKKNKALITADTVFYGDASLQAVWGRNDRANLIYMSDGCLLWNKAYASGTWINSLAGKPEEYGSQRRAFLGWFTEPEGGEPVTRLLLTGDTILYAHWGQPGWTVTFADAFAMDGDGILLTKNKMRTNPDGTLPEIPEGISRNSRFLGWYMDKKLTVPLTAETAVRGDTRIFAKTEKREGIKITLNTREYGAPRSRVMPEAILAKEDGTPGPLPQAEWDHNGYETRPFLGWFLADGTPVTETTVFTEDTTIYAKWKDGYKVSFASLGDPEFKAAYTDETGKLSSLPAARRRIGGNPPLGWYTPDGQKVTEETVFTADTELVPKWGVTVAVYTERSGSWGTGKIAEIETDENGRLPYLPEAVHEKGYPFTGWVNDEGAQITVDTVFTANAKIYGTWDKEGNQITFQGGKGGLPDVRTMMTKKDGTVDALPSAHHKYGLPFKGWSTTEDGNNLVTADTVFSAPLTKLYAAWIPSWKVSFRTNGGKVLGAKSVMADEAGHVEQWPDAEHPLKLSFTGWYLGNRKDAEKAGPETTFVKDTWVDARWSVPEVPAGGFKVTLNDRDMESDFYTSAEGKLFYLPKPVRSDAVFYGWYTEPTAYGVKVHNGTQIGGELTLYAAWLIPLTEADGI